MNSGLQALLQEIYEFGAANDQSRTNKMERMRNVVPTTGALLSMMVGATKSRHVLEVGTSNGYSTLWLADSAQRLGGRVTTLELLPEKAELAQANFLRAGLERVIDLHVGDAGTYLRSAAPESYDLIFLDSERSEYPGWWPDLCRVLVPGGLIIMDNALSHAAEAKPFLDIVAATPGYESLQLPLDQGVQLIYKSV